MPLGTKVGLGPSLIVLDGDPAPLPQMGTTIQFLAHVCYGQTAGWIKTPLGTDLGLGSGDIVGDPAPPKKGNSPHISAHVYYGQKARWIKMPLGTKVGLGPGHIVLHGDPAPPKQAVSYTHLTLPTNREV